MVPLIINPAWVKNIFSSNNTNINPASFAWKPILTARDLIYSPVLDTRKNNYYMDEVYYPYITTNQLGLFKNLPLLRLISFNKGSPKRDTLDAALLDKCLVHQYKI